MNPQAIKNSALYWKAFAHLAAQGKRDIESWNAACMLQASVGAPSDDDVKSIIAEALKGESHG